MSEKILRWIDAHLLLLLAALFVLRGGFLLLPRVALPVDSVPPLRAQ